jgi:hypothetical protein
MQRRRATSGGTCRRAGIATILLAAISIVPTLASSAKANVGYALAAPNPVLVSGIEFPHGVAVDQANHRVYVAVVTDESFNHEPGEIRRFESDGSSAGTFALGAEDYFSGVAVNPVTHGFYASQVRVETQFGSFGTSRMDPFSSSGVLGTPFALSTTGLLPQIATDSAGQVYFPNAATDSVQVFDSAGALQEEIACGACPGGPFGAPTSVAVDSAGDLYVADLSPDRVVKFTETAGSYEFDSVLQSGRGAAAVGVDPSTDDIFVGDFPNGRNYHVVAYHSSGAQFDDFGAGLFINPPLGAGAVAQIAADATTHKLYFTETNKIYVFERVTINSPSATAEPASSVGQLTATLNAKVNANGHAALECDFEYTDDGDFQANGFTNATVAPCSVLPDGSSNTPIDAELTGLLPATTYHFRVTAVNNGGSVSSLPKIFATLPAVPPTVTTESPLALTQTTATVRGKVNPHGGTVSDCHFEFGTSVSYGSSSPCLTLPGPVTTDVVETRKITGLALETGYHYRLVVTTNAGTSNGEDLEFKLTDPKFQPLPEASPPPSPPPTVVPTVPKRPLHCRRGFHKKKVRGKVRCVKVKRAGGRARRHHGHR